MVKFGSKVLSAAVGTAALGVVLAVSANAQSLTATTSCINGDVPANDYAEVGANFRETLWDQSAGVRVVSGNNAVQMTVVNETGDNVCEDRADLTAECRFKLRTGSTFWIKVDNTMFDRASTYKLCAF